MLRYIFYVNLHMPNIEPLFAYGILLSKKQNYLYVFFFNAINMFAFDILTAKFGPWTIITGMLYGLLGVATVTFHQKNTQKNIVTCIILGTLAYDFLTGCLLGPLMFNQNFMDALVGQIPFSLLHVLGNLFFTKSMIFIYENSHYERIHLCVLNKML